jgi:predicted O-methyltransferase YrrM
VHSPFVFDLVEKCFRDQRLFYALEDLKTYQEELEVSKTKLTYTELGAGKTTRPKEIKVKTFYARTKRPFKYYRLLFNLSRYFQPKTLLELGTGLGLSTLPLAGGSQLGHLHTIEGNGELSDFARVKLNALGYENITFHKGEFGTALPRVLEKVPQVDLAFLDGNHTYEGTLDYFNRLQPKLQDISLVILDDIHWSEGMEKAWQQLAEKPEVTLSIDLFFMGLLFFKPGMKKQHFVLRY